MEAKLLSRSDQMPIHDWSRVSAGTFHAFHNAWITHLQDALNSGILPQGFYAEIHQVAECCVHGWRP